MVLEAVDFRKKTITSKREVAQVEAQVLRMLEGYLMVEELLRLPSVEWDKPRDAPFPVVGDVAEADRGASALRSHWGLGIDPIPDLVEILEGRGVKVLSVTLAESIDGLTARVRRTRGGRRTRHRRERRPLGRTATLHDSARARPHGPVRHRQESGQ